MSELHLAIVKCRYPNQVQDELLKDQYIFGLGIKEVQDHLLGDNYSNRGISRKMSAGVTKS